jgi:hypothetical protein
MLAESDRFRVLVTRHNGGALTRPAGVAHNDGLSRFHGSFRAAGVGQVLNLPP